MIQIPIQLQNNNFRFCRVQKGTKKPFEKEWTKNGYNYQEIQKYLLTENYGVICGEGNLIVVDFDNQEVQDELINKFPKTFTVKTGSGMLHKYFISNNNKSFKIFDDDMHTLVDIQGEGRMVVGPTSVHPNGNQYEVVDDSPVAYLDYSEIQAIILPYDKKPKKLIEVKESPKFNKDFIELLKRSYSIEEVFTSLGIDTSKNPTKCPFHESKGGKCLSYHNGVWNCFHCEEKGDIITIVEKVKNLSFPQALEYLAEKKNLIAEFEESKRKYIESISEDDLPIEKEINKLTSAKLRQPENMKRILKEISLFEDEFIVDYLISAIAFKTKTNRKTIYDTLNKLLQSLQVKEIINIAEFMLQEMPPLEFYMFPLVPKNSMVMFGGKPGQFKSMFALSIALSFMQDSPFLGQFMIKDKPKVLYYDLENNNNEIYWRIKYLANGLNINPEKLKDFNLTKDFDKVNLKKELQLAMKYDIIFLDSYRRFLNGDENDSQSSDKFYREFLSPLKEAGKTIIVLHHFRKGNFDELENLDFMDLFRGSSDIPAQADIIFGVIRDDDENNNENGLNFNVTINKVKNRIGINLKSFKFNVTKNDIDKSTILKFQEFRKRIESPKEQRMNKIVEYIKNNPSATFKSIKMFAKNDIGVPVATLTRYLKELIDEERIIQPEYGVYKIS